MALLWGVLRYLELGRKRTLIFISIITALHFTDKATSYIFTAEILIFLALVFFSRVLGKPWKQKSLRTTFLIVIAVALIVGVALFAISYDALSNATANEGDNGVFLNSLPLSTRILIGGLAIILLVAIVMAIIFLVRGIGWRGVRDERSFDLLLLQGTIVLPLLAALPLDIFGFNPLDYSNAGILTAFLFIVPLFVIAVLIGIWWNWKVWVLNIGIFWAIFTVFYTSLFTQGAGFAMGLMGALGYWMSQQGVTRGTQPLYYYALVQIPIYEFLPAFGALLAAAMGIPLIGKARREKAVKEAELAEAENEAVQAPILSSEIDAEMESIEARPEENPPSRIVDNEGEVRKPPVLALLLFWSAMSLLAFSFAGERMPWLTTHITMPMILVSGWSFSRLAESIEWDSFKKHRGWLVLLIGALFLVTAAQAVGSLLGATPPFQGTELAQLQATSTFILAFVGMIASGVGLFSLLRGWRFKQAAKLVLVVFIVILAGITMRTAYRANFILYDTAQEFLVYAHAARDPKDVLAQVEEISNRLTGGKDIEVAYDGDLLYPYWWYFRDYPNKRYYADNPTRDLRDAPIILVGSGNFGKIEPVVANNYVQFDYTRLWWPTQEYYNLSIKRVWNAITDPEMRSALWQIWFNRNYEPYAALKNSDSFTLTNWQPSSAFRMYIRKDVVSEIWEYGASPVVLEETEDPYEAGTISLEADQLILGNVDYQMATPRDLAVAPDGTLYVVDGGNSRILHLDQDGNLLQAWGSFAASNYETNEMAPEGTFNDPWGIAVGPDGSVYVADTWNNRIQKFTADGQFITMWGQFGAAESRYHFWGPRGVAVDDQGRVYVTDTGNKRVVIFDSEGNDLAAFGGAGMGVGEFDEPVGIAVDDQGRVYIADTWNMRIQVMIPDGSDSLSYATNIEWDISAWYGDSLDNKPFLAVDADYNTFVADPISGRVLEFDLSGNFLRTWGSYGTGLAEIGIVSGLAVDADGDVWVADALNNRLMHFSLPELTELDAGTPEDVFGDGSTNGGLTEDAEPTE
jgi:DNA-binding beta-propeller fold protein YncE/MFS family permease